MLLGTVSNNNPNFVSNFLGKTLRVEGELGQLNGLGRGDSILHRENLHVAFAQLKGLWSSSLVAPTTTTTTTIDVISKQVLYRTVPKSVLHRVHRVHEEKTHHALT